MARTKQRETYGNGSVFPVMVAKTDKDGNAVIGKDGKPAKVQEKDKHGRPIWRVCITLGVEEYTDKSGKARKRQRKVQKRVHGTLDDARAVAKQLSGQFEHIDKDAHDKTFSDACAAWEVAIRNAGTATPNVITGYVRNLRHMEKHIGDKALISITKQDIESALAAVKQERRISNSTLHAIYAVTKRVFKYAVNSDWIVRNVVEKVKAPKIDEVLDRRSLTMEECAVFRARLDQMEDAAYEGFQDKEARQAGWGNAFGRSCLRGLSALSYIIALRIELATGLRRSEVLGLTWSAVDMESGQITVRQKLITTERKGRPEDKALVIGTPKTAKGTRTLYLGADALKHLQRWKAFQAKALHLVMPDGKAITQDAGTPVCVGDNGSWLRPSSISRWWGTTKERGFRDDIGFPDLRMHELRHTQATLLLGNGVDLKTVQVRMGHAKSSHTLDLYAHAIPANDLAAAELMDAITTAPAEPSARVVQVERKSA